MANASTPRTLSLNNFAPNAGVIRAGGGGTVAINGTLEAATGTVSIDLGGPAASQDGHLSVTGAATLSGTLNLAVVNGFGEVEG